MRIGCVLEGGKVRTWTREGFWVSVLVGEMVDAGEEICMGLVNLGIRLGLGWEGKCLYEVKGETKDEEVELELYGILCIGEEFKTSVKVRDKLGLVTTPCGAS